MTAFTIFAIAVSIVIFSHELLINRSGIIGSFYVVFSNVSNILSAGTLLTIFEEGFNLMIFRRAREERAKLKQERRELEELKKEIEDLQKAPQEGAPSPQPESAKADIKPLQQSTRPETKQPAKPENPKPKN